MRGQKAIKKAPKTSAPALEDAIEIFRPYVEAGQEIVSFSIADGMSSSGNIMRMAARELNAEAQIFVVDSANLSTGIGLLVIEAAIMAQNGCSDKMVGEIRTYLEQLHVFHEILETTAGGVVSCYCGPGTPGILFISKA